MNSFESDIGQFGECVSLDQSVECLDDLRVLAVVHRAVGGAVHIHRHHAALGLRAGHHHARVV